MLQIKKPDERSVQFGTRLSSVPVELGMPGVDDMWDELEVYIDILLGREDPPIDSPYLGMSEVATAYYMRAMEMDALIHNGERTGDIVKGSPYYRFRTGSLRSFIELSKRAAELGSRRLTQEQLVWNMREIEQ